jgi:hypothetical protein
MNSADTLTYDEENDVTHTATLSRGDKTLITAWPVSRHAEGR